MSWNAASIVAILALVCLSVVDCGQGASKDAKTAEPVKPSSQRVKVSIAEIEISAFEYEGGRTASSQKIVPPGKIASPLSVAENQRLVVKFTVKSEDGKTVKADQAFVRLTHPKADREIVLVADSEATGYKMEVDLTKRAADFYRLSGLYELRVEIGDIGFQNAVSAFVGQVKLAFPGGVEELPASASRYTQKPEIKHMFREPEKRPAAVVSTAFSFAVIAPFVLLWLLWARLGINFKNFDIHPSSLVFYGSLGGIFYLYYMFWLSFNMFTTLKYLSVLGLIAFFSGSAMFARMYRKRTGKDVKE